MVCSLIVGAEAPNQFLRGNVRYVGLEHFYWERSHSQFQEELWVVRLWCCLCVLTKDTGVGTALSPASTVGVRVGGSAVPVFTEPPHVPVC